MRKQLIAALVGAVAATIVAGGVALAAIPGPDGVIQGCYDSGGNVKVVAALPCPRNYTPFQWHQQGPPGTPGAPGANGSDGADGVSPSVTALAAGDSHCPAGGAALTDAAGTTAYVCSGLNGADGQPFSGTFTSPNGEYSISVTDAGIRLERTGGSVVELAGNDIVVQSAGAYSTLAGTILSLTSGSGFSLTSGDDMTTSVGSSLQTAVAGNVATSVGNNLTVDVGKKATVAVHDDLQVHVSKRLDVLSDSSTTLQSSTGLSLRGSTVSVNGGSPCQGAARQGDLVSLMTGAILTGSATVCIG